MDGHAQGLETSGAQRSAEDLRARVQALGDEVDAFLLGHGRLPASERHAVEDARLKLLEAARYLERAEEGRKRRRVKARTH